MASEEKAEMKYKVLVGRKEEYLLELEVEAASEEEAMDKAVEESVDHDFHDGKALDAEYDVHSITMCMEKTK